MVRTRVGYTGGTTPQPTYTRLGDHTETLQLDYDPKTTDFAALLDIFWAAHDPTLESTTRQYMSAIFYHDAQQRKLAEQTRTRQSKRAGRRVYTRILPAATFHLAEDYHQKYRLRQVPELLAELKRHYPHEADLVRSTAAARLNGYIGGHGTLAGLQAEIDSLGLSPAGRTRLLEIVKGR